MQEITEAFPTSMEAIEKRIHAVDPGLYAKTRNFQDGAVTRLSSYISRGVISTRQVYEHIRSLRLSWDHTEKLVQELAWRDYWQQVWRAKGDLIDHDLKHPQEPVAHHGIPKALLEGNTGVEAVDDAIAELEATGYMHNHMRMYVAAIACNFGQAHWSQPAKWMYYHLFDGDWASNALSWQWVAGANANKKYYANQANVNKYFNSRQRRTFMDHEYEAFEGMAIPEELRANTDLSLTTQLPETSTPALDKEKTTLVYNYYNLDPNWHEGGGYNRVLLLEPSFFERYPVSRRCMEFVLALAKNIPEIQVFTGEFHELRNQAGAIVHKEHPTNGHYVGQEEAREWMADLTGYFPSFFSFWKKYKKRLLS